MTDQAGYEEAVGQVEFFLDHAADLDTFLFLAIEDGDPTVTTGVNPDVDQDVDDVDLVAIALRLIAAKNDVDTHRFGTAVLGRVAQMQSGTVLVHDHDGGGR